MNKTPYIILRDDGDTIFYLFTDSLELPEITSENVKKHMIDNYWQEDFRVRDDLCENEENDTIIVQYFLNNKWESLEIKNSEFRIKEEYEDALIKYNSEMDDGDWDESYTFQEWLSDGMNKRK